MLLFCNACSNKTEEPLATAESTMNASNTNSDIITTVNDKKVFNMTIDEFVSAWNGFYNSNFNAKPPTLSNPYSEPSNSDSANYMYTLYGSNRNVKCVLDIDIDKASRKINMISYMDFAQCYKQDNNFFLLCCCSAIDIISNKHDTSDSLNILESLSENGGTYSNNDIYCSATEVSDVLSFLIQPNSRVSLENQQTDDSLKAQLLGSWIIPANHGTYTFKENEFVVDFSDSIFTEEERQTLKPIHVEYTLDGNYLIYNMGAVSYRNKIKITGNTLEMTDSINGETTVYYRKDTDNTSVKETTAEKQNDLYRSNLTYPRMDDIHNSELSSDNMFIEVSQVIEEFDELCENYMNIGDTKVFEYLKENTTAYEQQVEYKQKHPNLTQHYNDVTVQTVRQSENNYYAWVGEKISQTENGKETIIENDWVYRLHKSGNQWYIDDYTKNPLSK